MLCPLRRESAVGLKAREADLSETTAAATSPHRNWHLGQSASSFLRSKPPPVPFEMRLCIYKVESGKVFSQPHPPPQVAQLAQDGPALPVVIL